MTAVADDRRQWLCERAAREVAKTVADTKTCWGGGWFAITSDMRRGEVALRMLGVLCDIGLTDPAEVGVYAVAIANEVMRAKL